LRPFQFLLKLGVQGMLLLELLISLVLLEFLVRPSRRTTSLPIDSFCDFRVV
jgi:hypothetical protein